MCIRDSDQTVLGSGLPKVNFGLSTHMEYKGFDLNISTYGVLNYHEMCIRDSTSIPWARLG